jgi:L-rhamnose-H+ transport protein
MNGTFTLPMRFLGRWPWENVWAIFIVVSCIAMPLIMTLVTVSQPRAILQAAPARAVAIAMATGFAWGFGAIMFGQGVSAIGISMANTLVLAISSSVGSFLPMLILAPERLLRPQGKAILLGTAIALVGIAWCGYAGILRERSEREQGKKVEREMVGQTRPFWVGLALCAGAGLLSAVFNIGYSSAQAVMEAAVHLGNSAFAGSNLVWQLMLASGAVANLGFCAHEFRRHRTWSRYSMERTPRLYMLSIVMGLLWGGSIFVYGSASPKLGRLGPAIGWPLSLTVGLLTANGCGILAGEWRLARGADRAWMGIGLAVLLAAILVLGWSGSLA